MKKLFIVAILAICTMSAQAKIVNLGASVGMVNEKMEIVEYVDFGRSTGYEVSAVADFGLIPLLGVSAQVRYASQNFSSGDGDKLKSVSLDVPVLASFSIFGPIKIEAGPRFSLYDKADITYADGTESEFGRMRPEVGYTVGAKVSLFGKLFVAARYNGHFGDYLADIMYTTSAYYVNSSSYSITAGFTF
ncbi:MAG: hypothetical protein R3Y16_08220 [Rikenellaceae bacterium]